MSNQYTDSFKVDLVKLIEDYHRLRSQAFDSDTGLPYKKRQEFTELLLSSSDEQVAYMIYEMLSFLEGRVLGEHIAQANKVYKAKKIAELKELLGRSN